MKTRDELWEENMAFLEPTEMTQNDKNYVCGLMTRKDALYQYMRSLLLANDHADKIETLKILDGVSQ